MSRQSPSTLRRGAPRPGTSRFTESAGGVPLPAAPPSRRPRVLVIAFACGPEVGSEPANGWVFSRAASEVADVDVLTTTLYREEIEAALAALGQPAPRIHYVDPPRFASQGGLLHMLAYRSWKAEARKRAEALHATSPYDLVHHVTYANIWLEPVGRGLGLPLVVGPLNGAPRVAFSLYPALGTRGALREAGRLLFRLARVLDPRTRRQWSDASVALVANYETLGCLPPDVRARAHMQTNSVTSSAITRFLQLDSRRKRTAARPRTVLAAGRLLPWKGFALAIRALALLPEWHLTIVGNGPDKERLLRLADRCGVRDRLTLLEWLPQGDLWSLMETSRVLVVSSLRDDGPCVVTEALMLGVPVVALDQGLAGYLSGRPGVNTVRPASVSVTARRLAGAIRTAERVELTDVADLQWESLPPLLARVYGEAMALRRLPWSGT